MMTRTDSIVEPNQPPQFTTPLADQLNVREGGFAHFEARLEPMGDHSMTVEWFKDGRLVDASSRITSFFNFGYVALTIKQVSSLDAGVYSCVAKNAKGQLFVYIFKLPLSQHTHIFFLEHHLIYIVFLKKTEI